MKFLLRLTGPPSLVDAEGEPVPGMGPGKTLALLSYLARVREASRDELTALLWGSVDEERASNAFRQALHRLRKSIGEEVIPHDRDVIRLEAGDALQIDVDIFEEALDEGRVEDALEEYRGDFLEGLDTGEIDFAHWADRERSHLRARVEGALATAVDRALEAGAPGRALGWAHRRTELSPWDPDAALGEAEVLIGLGRRAEARSVLERHRQRIAEELDAEPRADVEEAIERLERAPDEGGPHASSGDRSGGGGGLPDGDLPAEGEAVLARLLGTWRRVREGSGTTVVLEGGTDRGGVAREFATRARALGPALVLRGGERVSTGEALPYASVADALRGALQAPGLAGANSRLLAEASRLVPELRDQFDLPAYGPVEGEAARQRLFEGTAELLDAVSYEQPVVLVLDSVDRSAEATRDLVEYLSGRLRDSRVLLLLLVDPGAGGWRLDEPAGPVERILLDGDPPAVVGEGSPPPPGDAPGSPRGDPPGSPRGGPPGPPEHRPEGGPPSGRVEPRIRWREIFPAVAIAATMAAIVLVVTVARPWGPPPPPGHLLRDTVVIVEPRVGDGTGTAWAATGALATAGERLTRTSLERAGALSSAPVSLPWMNPNPSPTGGHLALERMTAEGPDLYVVRGDRGDTVPVAAGPGDHIFADWAPDGRRLLVIQGRQGPDGRYDADLLVYGIEEEGVVAAIDTASTRSVSDAAFSPDGSRVAWAARIGGRGSSEIFVAPSGGGTQRSVSGHPADDLGPVWAPDGERLAFVSSRDGNLEIYAVVLENGELWRLTWEPARDGEPAFSPGGEFLAFESDRDGVRGVYVVPSWGGEAVRISRPGEPAALVGWR